MNNIFLYEIKRFFKTNIKKIAIGSLIVAILYTLFQFLYGSYYPINNEQPEAIGEEFVVEGIKPAYSQFYIENEDGSVYTNTSLILSYLFLPEVIDDIERQTGINIEESIEEDAEAIEEDEEVIGGNKTTNQSFYLYRDGSSNTYNFLLQLGNEKDNTLVMQYYYDMLINKELPVLENRNIYEIIAPRIFEAEESKENPDNSINIADIMLNLIIGLIMGAIGLSIWLLLKAILGSKLHYAFSYTREIDDLFLLFDHSSIPNSEFYDFLVRPNDVNKVFICQFDTKDKKESAFSSELNRLIDIEVGPDTKVLYANDLTDIASNFDYEEVILYVQGDMTDRNWYKAQRRVLKNRSVKTKVVHVNEN